MKFVLLRNFSPPAKHAPPEAPMSTGQRELRSIIADLRYIFRQRRSDKKSLGLKYCAHAGYGFRWFRGRKVPDPHEQHVMPQIVQWRQAGLSWQCISVQLFRQGIRTAAGPEWSVARVRRAYAAALRLHEQERQAAASPE